MHATGLPAQTLSVVGESRTVQLLGDGSFTDSFGTYGVHIYSTM